MKFDMSIPQPFNFEATLKTHGWFQLPPFYWDESSASLNWAVRLNDHVTVVQVKTTENTKAFSRVRFEGNLLGYV